MSESSAAWLEVGAVHVGLKKVVKVVWKVQISQGGLSGRLWWDVGAFATECAGAHMRKAAVLHVEAGGSVGVGEKGIAWF